MAKQAKPQRKLRGRAASTGLTKSQIIAAAVAQIDERGLQGFSLRELATTLDVSPTTIYWHVGGSKEDLFAEISASITGSLSGELTPGMSWQERLRRVFLNYRTQVAEHANVAPLLGAQLKSNGVANLAWVETVLTALEEAGFRGAELRYAFNALIGGLAGFVTMEFAPAPAEKADEWEQLFAERVAEISPEAFPRTHAMLPEISNKIFVLRWQNGCSVPFDDSYAYLLDVILAGLEARAQTTLS